jgi:hypothetical protein
VGAFRIYFLESTQKSLVLAVEDKAPLSKPITVNPSAFRRSPAAAIEDFRRPQPPLRLHQGR